MISQPSFEEKIEQIKIAILKHVPAKYIYLFGSYAYGEPTEESDIDIYAVVPDETKDIVFIQTDIASDLWDQNISSVDLHLHKEVDFIKRREASLFVRTICQNGRLLYESY